MRIERVFSPQHIQAEYMSGQRYFQNLEIASGDAWSRLSDICLDGATFFQCCFHSTTFQNVSLEGIRFDQCNLKCATFVNCNLRDSKWMDCSVCAIEIKSSIIEGIHASLLDAYGYKFKDVDEFLKYALLSKPCSV